LPAKIPETETDIKINHLEMNISHASDDAVSGIIKLEIEKKDYTAQVDKGLRQYRQSAAIPGFRKGMAPMGMIRKMYGKHLMSEEVSKLVSENLYKYVQDNGLKVLGQPIPNQNDRKPVDFDNGEENFEFCFDIALSPPITIKLTKRDKLNYYQLIIDENMIDKQMDTFLQNFDSYDIAGEIEANDLVKGILIELEDGVSKEGGILVENAVLMPNYIKDETEQAKFIGAKLNDAIVFNPKVACQGAVAEIASLLGVSTETAETVTSDFRLEVNEIMRQKKAELNQDLYDKLYGTGVVKSEEECREKTKVLLSERFRTQSDYKFWLDIRKLLLKKAGNIQLADDILKRWLISTEETNTLEKVEKEYPSIVENLKFQLITNQLLEANNLKIEEREMLTHALQMSKEHYAYYGYYSVPEDELIKYARNLLAKKEAAESILERAMEQKLVAWIREKADVIVKDVSLAEFEKIIS
jgi:trigger factor